MAPGGARCTGMTMTWRSSRDYGRPARTRSAFTLSGLSCLSCQRQPAGRLLGLLEIFLGSTPDEQAVMYLYAADKWNAPAWSSHRALNNAVIGAPNRAHRALLSAFSPLAGTPDLHRVTILTLSFPLQRLWLRPRRDTE